MASLNWVDYVIFGIFFFSILAGLSRGLVKEVISLLTLIAAFIIAIMFSNTLAMKFTSSESVQQVTNQAATTMGGDATQMASYAALGISFTVLFVGTIIVGWLFGFFVNLAFKTGVLGIGNRFFGGIFGLGRGFLINLVLIFLVQLTPFSSQPFWQEWG